MSEVSRKRKPITMQKCVLLQRRITLVVERTNILRGKENLEDAILKIQQRESHVKAKQVCTGIRIMIMFLFLVITCFEIMVN